MMRCIKATSPNVAPEAEDLARADLYALLGSLFYAPPPIRTAEQHCQQRCPMQ